MARCGGSQRSCGEKHRGTVAPPRDNVVHDTLPRPPAAGRDLTRCGLSPAPPFKGTRFHPIATIPHQRRPPLAGCFPTHPHLSVALRRLGACGPGRGRARAGLWGPGGLPRSPPPRVVPDEAAAPWSRTSPAPRLRQPLKGIRKRRICEDRRI